MGGTTENKLKLALVLCLIVVLVWLRSKRIWKHELERNPNYFKDRLRGIVLWFVLGFFMLVVGGVFIGIGFSSATSFVVAFLLFTAMSLLIRITGSASDDKPSYIIEGSLEAKLEPVFMMVGLAAALLVCNAIFPELFALMGL